MSFTLYTANPNALIPQSGRTVDTFPSGLVRVTQTYLGRTANAAAHRVTLAVGNNMPDGDSSPCIDGLKIFPEVQERRREDGMTEFIVTAYGRVNTTGERSENANIGRTLVVFNNFNVSYANLGISIAQKTFTYEMVVGVPIRKKAIASIADISIPQDSIKPYSIKVCKHGSSDEIFIPFSVWENAVLSNGTQPFFTYNSQNLTIWNSNALAEFSSPADLRFATPRIKAPAGLATLEALEFTPYGAFNEVVIKYSANANDPLESPVVFS